MKRTPTAPFLKACRTGSLGLLALLTLGACKHSARNYLSRHVVPVCPTGELADFRFKEPRAADGFEPVAGTDLPSQIDYVLDAAEFDLAQGENPGGPLRLMLHVHGGRKTLKDSAKLADELITVMGDQGRAVRAAGGTVEAPLYPIFVQWQSADLSTVKDRVLFLRQGNHLSWLGPLSSPFILTHDLVRGIARLPRSLGYQLLRDLNVATSVARGKESFGSEADAAAVVDALASAPDTAPDFDVRAATYSRGTLNHGLRFITYFLTQPTKIASQGLFLEGLGQGAWDEMRRRAHGLVWRPDTFEDGRAPHSVAEDFLRNADSMEFANGALPLLYERLATAGRPVELTLVAHSMGSIAVNDSLTRLTRAIADAGGRLTVPRILYMAPACSTIDAADSLVPFLERTREAGGPPTHFYYLALHPTAEADETNAFDLVPRGSLLEWIDVYYTNPATVPERVFGKWSNAIPALSLFAPVADQVHFKAFDVDGSSFPQKHGQFHEIPFWTRAAYGTGSAQESFEANWLERRCSDVIEQCKVDVLPYRAW